MKNIYAALSLFIGIMAFGQNAPMNVIVTDFNNKPIKGEKILFQGQKTGHKTEGVSNTDGKFKVELPGGDIYDIKVIGVGDEQEYSTIEIPSLGENEVFNEATMQVQIEEWDSFTLDDLHFKTGSAVIEKSSYPILDQLVEYMNNKGKSIEIGGHTDSDGSDESNQKLSQNRAKAVKDYLVTKGIDKSRISAKGYGESKPIASNDTDAGKAQNRRTEVKVL